MICIPISGASNAEMLSLMGKAAKEPSDLLELRLDSLEEAPDVEGLLAASPRPAIVTCRSRAEGGGFAGPDGERRAILRRACLAGAAYIDAEAADVPILAPDKKGAVLIASMHDFDRTPANLSAMVADLAALPCDWVKFAVAHRRPADGVAAMEALRASPKPCIAISMGEGGLWTRVLGPAYGSKVTFASLDPGYESAPGQPTARDLSQVYCVDGITPETPVYGLLGNPVAQSRGFRLHNWAFGRIDYDGVYIPFLAENAEEFLESVPAAINLRGLSVTIPHKPAALAWAETRSDAAVRIGAANTLTLTGDGWRAENTDMPAIFESIKEVIDMEGQNLIGEKALLLGAGGTTRAAGLALSLLGCRITVAARNEEKAWRLAGQMDWDVEPMDQALRGEWKVVANTTPVGMYPKVDATLFPASAWREGMVAFDAVHNPRRTRFLKEAAAAGAFTVDGVEMFLRQAAEQFRLWTGKAMPRITSLT